MPDDEKTEVTEQTETEVVIPDEVTETSGENAKEALAGFNDDEEGDKKSEPKEEVEKLEEKEPAEKSEEKPEVTAEAEKETEGGKESEAEEEVDEDEVQGKQIIEDEEKREKEALKADEAEQEKLEKEETAKQDAKAPEEYSAEDMNLFHNVIPDAVFPEKVKIGETEFFLKDYVADNPEVKTVASIVSKGVVDALIRSEYLPSFQAMEEKIFELEKKISDAQFKDKITDPHHGVPKAIENYNSDKFKEWHDKQSEGIQALFRSNKPADHIKGHRRFLKAAGLEKADKTVADLDKKRQENKAKADSIYKTTSRSKAKAKVSKEKGSSPLEQERDGFNSSDDEEHQA